jgi:hypothetical protein
MKKSQEQEKRISRLCKPSTGLIVTLFIIAGCSADNPALVPVTGLVTMDSQPIAELIVTFTPTGNTLGNGALGGTNKMGHFTLTDVRGSQGAHMGEYKISVYPTPTSDTAGLPTDVVSSSAAGIPDIFMDPNHSPLRVIVPKSGAEVEVALTRNEKDARVNVISAATDG